MLKLAVLSLITGLALHAVQASPATCEDHFASDHPFRLEVEKLEEEVDVHRENFNQVEQQLEDLEDQIHEVQLTMGYREQTFWRWLARLTGGGVAKMDLALHLDGLHEQLMALSTDKYLALKKADREVIRLIAKYLSEQDELFIELQAESKKLYQVVHLGHHCVDFLNQELNRHDNADIDHYFSSTLAIDATSEATRLSRIEKMIDNYLKEVSALSRDHLAEIDRPDLKQICDSDILKVREFIETIHARIDASYLRLKKELERRVCETRTKCAAPP